MLRACHRVLTPEGRVAYYTIYVPPDVSAADYRRSLKFWPAVGTRGRWPAEMLRSAGFSDVEETDVTKQFRTTSRGWLAGYRRHYEGLKRAFGEEKLGENIAQSETMRDALKDGRLKRSLLTGQRPA